MARRDETRPTAPVAASRRTLDLGVVTTVLICLSLAATFALDQLTDADLRMPLRIFDLACVAALVLWQFRRIHREIRDRARHALALAAANRRSEDAIVALERARMNMEMALGAGELGFWNISAQLDDGDALFQPAFLDAPFTADDTALAFCGFPPGTQMTPRDFLHVIHPDDRQRTVDTLNTVYREGTHLYRHDYRVVWPNGEVRLLRVRGSLVATPNAIRGIDILQSSIAKDVTDEEALKADLIAKAEEARAARDAKGRFLAMMSHELRTPMNGVLGLLDLVIDTPLEDEQRTMLQRCRQSARILLTLLNDILDFSKIEAGKLSLESTSLSLRSLVDDVCADYALQSFRKGVSLDTDVDPYLPQFVLGDPVRLRQILGNLLSNALKFTARGRISVRVQACGAASWALEVEDTGPGIAPETLARLFKPFQQADASTTRRYGGTGLGLSIIKQLTELMGGSVACRSEVGQGSCFRVVLPLKPWVPALAATQADAPPMQEADVAPTLAPRRFLVAEDSPINQEVLQRQLAKLGHRCDCVEDGETAWTRLRTPDAEYDALITDGDMPRLDGYALTERIRAWELQHGAPRLPILAMTANAMRGDRERCLAAGMDAYVSKPVEMPALQQALASLFAELAMPGLAPAQDAHPYARLHALCNGDVVAISKVLATFVTSVGEDATAFHEAWREAFEGQLRYLAHKMASGCMQVDEAEACRSLQAVEDARDMDRLREVYPPAEAAVWDALARARGYLARHGRGE